MRADSARAALTEVKVNLDRVLSERASIGAYQSRFKTVYNVLASTRVNLEDARSRIEDVDIAETSAELLRSQILQQVAVSGRIVSAQIHWC